MDGSLRILGQLLPAFFMADLTELHATPSWVGIRKLTQPPPRPLSQALVDAARPLVRWDVEVYATAAVLLGEQAAGCQNKSL